MVSSFQDGDPSIGHGRGYGPSHHNGDLQGIINALDYIKDLGFNAIWMTPIFESSIQDKQLSSTGYYPNNYFNIDPHFGTTDKFRELVQAAHNKGIYIILDGVFGHHGENVKTSPKGNTITDKDGTHVKYPESLEFFKEVAQYWIDNYEIDGWRLDVAKELVPPDQNGNYLHDIRKAVEEVSDRRRNEGKQWGILGYVVGEYWASLGDIKNNAYSGDTPALRSAFDFPFRYNIVQSLAQDENGDTQSSMINAIKDVHRTPYDKTYGRDDIYPNLFFSNHDLYRFGNLLRMRHGLTQNDDDYWRYHKIAIATLAVYTGPITLYYGDEIGEITECWYGKDNNQCGETKDIVRTDDSSNARTNGRISGFTPKQTELHDFTRELMNARLNHPSMWRGTNGKTTQGDVYFNCKYDPVTGDKVVFITNFAKTQNPVHYQVGGVKLYDLVTKEVIYSYENGGKYYIPLGPLETRVFQVFDEDVEVTVTVQADCAAQQEIIASEKQNSDKKVIIVIAIASVVVVIVIVVAVAVVLRMKRKYAQELRDAKSNPLVDMSLE